MSVDEAASIEFRIDPSDEPDRLATCVLSIRIDGQAVWPVLGDLEASLEIQGDDLLSYLTEFWKPLLLRQNYPAPFNPARPSCLRADATRRWAENPPATADREDEAVTAFEDAHDVSRAFAGLFDLPSFWVFRNGAGFLCESQEKIWQLPFAVMADHLAGAGDALAERLAAGGDKWDALIAAWKARDEVDAMSLLAWSAGLDLGTSHALVEKGLIEPPTTFAEAVNDNDELRIAARLAGALPEELLVNILGLARSFAWHEAEALGALSQDCRNHIDERYAAYPPYVQGEAAARRAREWLNIGHHHAVDVFSIVEQLGGEIRGEEVEPEGLDGLAIWGDKFGPGMFLNLASERVCVTKAEDLPGDAAARVTAAHELCHLLLDGSHAVSAVDVLMSRMPVAIEQRAKSFAGEFLLPSRTAARHWEDAGRPMDREGLRAVLAQLADQFGVPKAVASWKLDHGLQFWDVDLSVQLDSLSRWR